MARKKRQVKAKEPVRVRFKSLANGNKSIYLDKYKDGVRTYEFLKLYLVPEVDEASKAQNVNTLQAANAIKSKRIIEMANDAAGIASNPSAKITLDAWMTHCKTLLGNMGKSKSTLDLMGCAIEKLKEYNYNVSLRQIDMNYCRGFIAYLNTAKKHNGKSLSKNTIALYCNFLSHALNIAVRENVIQINPFTKLSVSEKPALQEGEREYLTIDEVKKLMATKSEFNDLRCAFLFSCFCGLRKSDIMGLKWGDIQKEHGTTYLHIIVKKTKKPLTLPLSDMALRWLPSRGTAKDDEAVFNLPTGSFFYSTNLKKWAKKAGINKTVTFHVARHTFATMELTAGADIYTTSKLLGHSDVKTTQIYAKIIDKKKADAVNLLTNLFV